MNHLRVLPETGPSETPLTESTLPDKPLTEKPLAERGVALPRRERPEVTVLARITPEHDHEDIAELLNLAARSAAVQLHLEFAAPGPSEADFDAGPDFDLPAFLRSVPEEAVRVRVLVPGRVVLRDGERVHLSRLEFDLLRFLAERPGRVFSREALLEAVWGGGEVTPRTVDVHVRRLRCKLGRDLQLLSTVRGVGYRLDPGQLRLEQAAS